MRKKLVLGYLEKVGSNVFSDFPKEITSLVAGKHGVYALYKGDHLYYVGLASDLHRRVNHHLRDKHAGKWSSFSLYLIHKSDHIKELESLILRMADPKGNSVKGRMPHAENMTHLLKCHIKKRQDIDLNSVLNLSFNPRVKKVPKKAVLKKSHVFRLKLSAYAGKRFALQAVYKKKLYKASILTDGTIIYNGRRFTSPSMAASTVIGRPTNGWTFWSLKNPAGIWVSLDTLRK